ncbi:GyrI-like domain-containing protein [Chengkuizengella axinellae]|uniref:GyrI-like domain-containing protein n=1 Tax=Chengkuizengella axinellae TaxID=3064388 RepID=A0ABT9J576_9BACL|nr:GyrI-like domain-containing protein [Chengkuizengella sp. 2205SS18-9]MDP5276775.1 GyrI-like domain-containing protein [Chengkuizengella sp. 2205SS18-9]
MVNYQYEIVQIPAYRGIGLKWDGPYTEISDLKKMINEMSSRVNELEQSIHPEIHLGLSYHLRNDGFIHYSVFEVSAEQQIPEGMVEIHVPEMTYLKTHHKKGEDIGYTYHNIYQWLKENDIQLYKDANQKYYDALPIKHEKYPIDHDKNNPHFDILIPIVKKKQEKD